MKKLGFGKKSDDGDDSSRRALFGSRSKSKSPAPSNNPYAQPPQVIDPYTRAKIDAGLVAPPAGFEPKKAPQAANSPGGYAPDKQRPGPGPVGGDGRSGSGYAPDRYGNQGGYGGDKYGGGSGNKYGGGSKYGAGGYGGLGMADPNDPGDANRDALFGGAQERVQKTQDNPPPYDQGSSGQSGAYGDNGGNDAYGAYRDRQLTEEEQEEEDVQATKGDIRRIKQNDVSATRNAIRIAAETEETGRNTLARLGAQGERIHNTSKHLDLAANQNRMAEDKARELKTLNKSMFAVHVSNPFTSADRRRQRDEEIINRHQDERDQRTETRVAAYRANQRMEQNFRELNKGGPGGPGGKAPGAERSKYQFEADSEDEALEDELDANLDALGGAVRRINGLAKATGEELQSQNDVLKDVIAKSDMVDDGIHMNRAKLDRIH